LSASVEVVLKARKSPVQARSAASVDAMLEATVQVLRSVGKERLTTTRVAARAGVSVGTLYQYFPNKSALLQAALERHLNGVTEAVESACLEQRGRSLEEMATALVTAFLDAKMGDARHGSALYAVSADLDGAKVLKQMQERCNRAVVGMLVTAREGLGVEPELVATMLQGAMAGVSRRLMEVASPEKHFAEMRRELVFFSCAYVNACAGREMPELVARA
jgi:AcrR family transcriptional regulator